MDNQWHQLKCIINIYPNSLVGYGPIDIKYDIIESFHLAYQNGINPLKALEYSGQFVDAIH